MTVAQGQRRRSSRSRWCSRQSKAYRDRWTSPFEREPFDVPIGEKLELLRGRRARDQEAARRCSASGRHSAFHSEDKYFASSEGSSIQQFIMQTFAQSERERRGSREAPVEEPQLSSRRRCRPATSLCAQMNLKENARRIREEVVEHLDGAARDSRARKTWC